MLTGLQFHPAAGFGELAEQVADLLKLTDKRRFAAYRSDHAGTTGYCSQDDGQNQFKRTGAGHIGDFDGVLGFGVIFDEALQHVTQ